MLCTLSSSQRHPRILQELQRMKGTSKAQNCKQHENGRSSAVLCVKPTGHALTTNRRDPRSWWAV